MGKGKILPLSDIKPGEICKVCSILAKGSERRRLLDLGIIQGTKIEVLNKSPSGDPTSYFIRGIVIALRCDCAKKVIVKT